MAIGISDVAFSFRKRASSADVKLPLGHAQQMVAAVMGYKTLASFQAAQSSRREPSDLELMFHLAPDYRLLESRASDLDIRLKSGEMMSAMQGALLERVPGIQLHSSVEDLEAQAPFALIRSGARSAWVGEKQVTFAEALADLLDLDLELVLAECLVDAEIHPLDGSTGDMVYSYLIKFDGLASPEVERYLMDRYGKLEVEVGPWFFDNIRQTD